MVDSQHPGARRPRIEGDRLVETSLRAQAGGGGGRRGPESAVSAGWVVTAGRAAVMMLRRGIGCAGTSAGRGGCIRAVSR